MKISRLFFAAIAAACAFDSVAFSAPANPPSPVPSPNAWSPWNQADTRMLVTEIDPAGGTIQFKSMKTKITHSFKIDEKTQITVNGVRATADRVEVGMQIQDIRFRDALTMASFSVGKAAPPPKPGPAPPPVQIVKPAPPPPPPSQ